MVIIEIQNRMNNELVLPRTVVEAYPLLLRDTIQYVGRFTSKVPATPDRIYDIYNDTTNNRLLAHVTTDHPDPIHDSEELRGISGGEYVFKDIVTPNSVDSTMKIVGNDDYIKEFFIKDGTMYHYVANTERDPTNEISSTHKVV